MGGADGNLEAVRRLFETGRDYIKGDREAFEAVVREVCAEDVEVMPSSALASGDAGPFYGHRGLLSQQAGVADRWADFDITPEDYVEVSPNVVVLLGKVSARRGDGSGYAMELGIVNRFEDGRIAAIHSYQSKSRALEEAGLKDLRAVARPGK